MKWITAANLEQWAETLQARAVFPGLVADLIRASATEISGIRFPNGDKGQVRGFDGVLAAAGVPPYVPDGDSIWEFGVTGDVIGKADGDYKKRTEEVDVTVRANTTFVFVSPRTWDRPRKKIADWLKEKRDLGEWKEVEYFDGVAVETWLDSHPAVASRYAKYELRLMPQTGASSTDEFWQEYSNRFNPPLVEDVLLASREAQAKNLIQQLLDGARRLPFAADSPDEVIAFAVAALRRADTPIRLYLESRTLVVDTEDAARQLSNRSGLIYLPRGQARRFAGVLALNGPTIVSAGADEQRGAHELLTRPSNSAMGRAFEQMGFPSEKGYELARKCGRSLAVLARQIPSGTAERPEWIRHAHSLLPALLAGAWMPTNLGDKAILQLIGGTNNYETIEAPIRPLAKLRDPPIDRVGDVWSMRAPIDAFVHLAHLLGEEHLSRFADAVTEVFSKIAPIPTADEVYRPAAEREDTYSSWIREGMMATLLNMAVLHEQAGFSLSGTTPQKYVNDIVRKLPGLSSDYRLMASLQENLTLLAEAAPGPFLDALERLLEGDAVAIKPIFEEQKGLLTSHSRHSGVLWALESLAWEPEYLLRVAICLARLAAIDPGGSMSNRPINSLRHIFLTWSPNTRANAKQRQGVLAYVLKTVPNIAWEFLLKLLPQHYDSSSSTAKPKFRESTGASTEVLTYGVVWESQAAIIELAIKEAEINPERWEKLVGVMDQFQPAPFERTLETLDKVLEAQTGSDRFRTWDALRKEVNRHRTFRDAQWAYEEGTIDRLDALIAKYRPEDTLLLNTWLFDDWLPDVPQKMEFTADSLEAVEQARAQALREVIDARGAAGVVDLAKAVKLPQLVASALSKLELPPANLASLLHAVIGAGDSGLVLAATIVADGFTRANSTFADEIRTIITGAKLMPARVARLFFGMPDNCTAWNVVASFGKEIDDAYWNEKYAAPVSGPVEDLLFAAEKYQAHSRPLAAVQAMSPRLREVPSQLLLQLLDGSVAEINASGGANVTMTVYYIEQVFSELEKRTDITSDDVAQREFVYLSIFNHREKPLTLHRLMTENPETFMSAICAVYKPTHSEAPEVTLEAQKLATGAYKLLGSLHVLPGQNDGNVDVSTLRKWCNEVRELAKKMDRRAVTDLSIGHLLAHAPSSALDEAWPHESVRTVIEELSSEDVERGVVLERINMRGVYSKALDEGGQQERSLAQQARSWATAMPIYPRTSAILVRIAEVWDQQAADADIDAEKEALRW